MTTENHLNNSINYQMYCKVQIFNEFPIVSNEAIHIIQKIGSKDKIDI